MKVLPSARFSAQSADDILGYLTKSATEASSEKITQGIALSILDSKRPANSGTLMKYVRAKCGVEIAPHAFSVAVAFAALNGTGVAHVEETVFLMVPLKWHLQASAIVNVISKPDSGLDDAARAAVHEEIAVVYRAKPEKGEDLLKIIKERFKPSAGNATTPPAATAADGATQAPGANPSHVADPLSDAYIKATGMAATECADKDRLMRVAQLFDYIRATILTPRLAEMGVTEVASLTAAPAAPAAPAMDADLAKELAELAA